MELFIGKTAFVSGMHAADKVSGLLKEAISMNGKARMVVSTGASQFEFFDSLTTRNDIPWECVEVFHLDEYIGISDTHKASFRKYLKERFIAKVSPGIFHEVSGEGNVDDNIRALTGMIRERPVDVGVIGIGENAHIAFNDPPADFGTLKSYMIVELDERCKIQQVNEGWFPSVAEVPSEAITMTVHQILQCRTIVSVVPHKEKAQAVKDTLESDIITNSIPATALRNHTNWFLYLDEDSATLLRK